MRLFATIYSALALIVFYRIPLQTQDLPFFIALHFALIVSLATFRLSFRRGSQLMLVTALLLVVTGFYLLLNTDLQDVDFAYGLLCGPLYCAMPYGIFALVLWVMAAREHKDVTQQ